MNGDKVEKGTDTDLDLCPGEFYTLSAGAAGGDGVLYRVEMASEDGVKDDFFIIVLRGS